MSTMYSRVVDLLTDVSQAELHASATVALSLQSVPFSQSRIQSARTLASVAATLRWLADNAVNSELGRIWFADDLLDFAENIDTVEETSP